MCGGQSLPCHLLHAWSMQFIQSQSFQTGGIGDGRGIAAALMLGASGAWLGTRFIACKESPFHEIYKERDLEAEETDTEYTTLFDLGWENAPHRVLRNKTIEAWEKAGIPPQGKRPKEGERAAITHDGRKIPYYTTEDTIRLGWKGTLRVSCY